MRPCVLHPFKNFDEIYQHQLVEPRKLQKKWNSEGNTPKHDEILQPNSANEIKKPPTILSLWFRLKLLLTRSKENHKKNLELPLLKNESLAAQRWRKLLADFANATQFYQSLKTRKSRRIP